MSIKRALLTSFMINVRLNWVGSKGRANTRLGIKQHFLFAMGCFSERSTISVGKLHFA